MLEINKKELSQFRFIDLFAGIGGFHYAMDSFGAKCVFASEWDKYAAETYHENFHIHPKGDITLIHEKDIPDHEILCAGFPCQAFSISGLRRGFEDTRGTLFFEIARITKYHKPMILLLENVKNILKHDNGNTLATITECLTSLGYKYYYKVLNTSNFGLPQNRERAYIVAFRSDLEVTQFNFPETIDVRVSLNDVLESSPKDCKIIHRDDILIFEKYNTIIQTINNNHLANRPIQIGIVNKGGQGERIYHPAGHAVTLSAYGGGIGSKTGLYLINNTIRKLTTRECARIQGFPEYFVLNNSQGQSYKQFGNSVSINVLQLIIKEITKVLISKGIIN